MLHAYHTRTMSCKFGLFITEKNSGRDAAYQREALAEILVDAVSVVALWEHLGAVVQVVQKAAARIIWQGPELVHEGHGVGVETGRVQVGGIGDALYAGVKLVLQRDGVGIELQAALAQRATVRPSAVAYSLIRTTTPQRTPAP